MDTLSFWSKDFWDLVLMKYVKNTTSMKLWVLVMLYIPIIWGMFHISPITKAPWISDIVGCGVLGGGFVTLATSRLIANISLNNRGDTFDQYAVRKDNTDEESDVQ